MQDLSADSANSPAEPFAFEWEGKAGFQAAGMFWQGGFLSCGGKTSSITATDKCFHLTLGSESSTEYPSMKIPRVGHASTIYQGRLWVTGGEMGKLLPYVHLNFKLTSSGFKIFYRPLNNIGLNGGITKEQFLKPTCFTYLAFAFFCFRKQHAKFT